MENTAWPYVITLVVGGFFFLFFPKIKNFFEKKRIKKSDSLPDKTGEQKPSPALKKSGVSALKWVWTIFAFLVISFLIYYFFLSPSTKQIADNGNSTKGTTLELMFDNYTPCNPPIDYKFELDTQGDSISLKFPGVETLIKYSGKGTIKVPPREFGPVKILSLNPQREARIRIWKVKE